MAIKKANKIRIYKLLAVLAAAVILYWLAAFSNMPTVDERNIVAMMGIDASDDGGIKVTAHVLVPVTGGENTFNQDTESAEGKDLFDALNQFGVMQGRKVEFGKCAVLVFGQTMAERGILTETQNLLAAGTVNPGTLMIVAADSTAEDFLGTALDLGEETGENIGKLLARFQSSLAMPQLNLLTFLSGNAGESGAHFIPCVKLKQKDNANEGEDGAGAEPNRKPKLNSSADIDSVDTAAAFKGGKLVKTLTVNQTQGLNLTLPSSKRGSYQVDGFTLDGQKFGALYAEIPKKTAKTTTYFKDGKPVVRYDVCMKIDVKTKRELLVATGTDAKKEKELNTAIEKAFQTKAASQIESAVAAAKETNADFLGIKYRFCRRNAREMQVYEKAQNSDFLNDITAEIRVNAKVI